MYVVKVDKPLSTTVKMYTPEMLCCNRFGIFFVSGKMCMETLVAVICTEFCFWTATAWVNAICQGDFGYLAGTFFTMLYIKTPV